MADLQRAVLFEMDNPLTDNPWIQDAANAVCQGEDILDPGSTLGDFAIKHLKSNVPTNSGPPACDHALESGSSRRIELCQALYQLGLLFERIETVYKLESTGPADRSICIAYIRVLLGITHCLLARVKDQIPEAQETHQWSNLLVWMHIWCLLHPSVLGMFCPKQSLPLPCPANMPCADWSWSQRSTWYISAHHETSCLCVQTMESVAMMVHMSTNHKLHKQGVIRAMQPALALMSAQDIPPMETVKGLCLVAHVTPQLFAPAFMQKLGQLMQRLVSNTTKWITSDCFFLVSIMISTIASVILWTQHEALTISEARMKPHDVLQTFALVLEPIIAAEAIMRQCATPEFQQRFSLIKVAAYLFQFHPVGTLELMARYSLKTSYPMSSKSPETHKQLVELQRSILDEIWHLCACCLDQAYARMSRPDSSPIHLPTDLHTDLTIECSDSKTTISYCVHKHILCSRSEYFRVCLSSQFCESSSHLVHLFDSDPMAIGIILQWLYNPNTQFNVQLESAKKTTMTKTMVTLSLQEAFCVLAQAEYLGITALMNILLVSVSAIPLMTMDTVEGLGLVALRYQHLEQAYKLRRMCYTFLIHHAFKMPQKTVRMAAMLLECQIICDDY